MPPIPSPALAIVGRHNSGKTTLIVQLIAELVARGCDVGSVKHHGHKGFDIDHPGKDSYRHREAGASETVIAAPGQIARMKTIEGEVECSEIVRSMPGHDIVIVEGYRKSGLPTVEIMRAGNPADSRVAEVFAQGAREGWQLGTDFVQTMRNIRVAQNPIPPEEKGQEKVADAAKDAAEAPAKDENHSRAERDLVEKMPGSETVAIVTDIPCAIEAAQLYGIPSFALDDISGLADFVEEHYVRPEVTVVIQAGGESKRMGRSKATVPFLGRPLICRLVERLSPVADELVVTTNEPDNLAFLQDKYPDLGIRLVTDGTYARGALRGLHTALAAASNRLVALVACDMVFASAPLIVEESIAIAERGADVVVPVNRHGYEPFHAIYNRDTCLPAVEDALARGDLRAQSFFCDERITVEELPQKRVLEVEPMGGCFKNANTPQELEALENQVLDSGDF